MALDLHGGAQQVKHMLASPKRSALISGSLHAAAIALVLLVTSAKTPPITFLRPTPLTVDIERYFLLTPRKSNGGGGGGQRHTTPASRGALPRAALRQFTPPIVVPVNLNPRFMMEPTIIGDMPPVTASQYGDPNGIIGLLSGGPGSGGGIGTGKEGGVGPLTGPGAGDDPNGTGITGRTRIERKITAPVLISKIEPEYSEEARKAKLQGTVMLRIDVDEHGATRNISVLQSLGLGLDERAIEAVRRWRFRPGTLNGKPAVTSAAVEVNFRLL